MNAKPWQTLVNRIADTISAHIDNGVYSTDEQLPSINIYSRNNSVARDTVEKAYRKLKREGYIQSIPGKGYFVVKSPGDKIRILIAFDKLTGYKKNIYDSIIEAIGDKGKVDLYIHNYSPAILDKIISAHLGQYHYYVILPAFMANNEECLKVLSADQLNLLDKDIPASRKRGVIETACNDLLEMAVISANAEEMGRSVVKMILNDHSGIIRNSFKTFVGSSL